MTENSKQRATFTSFENSTPEDWALIARELMAFAEQLPERVLAHMRLLADDHGGFPVSRLDHQLQTAMLAADDGRDDEYVVRALIHDIGDSLAPMNHPSIAAGILKPYVSAENLWMVEKHQIFQGYDYFHHFGMDRNARDKYRNEPGYERTLEFCAKYDGPAFDPARKTPSLEEFAPTLRKVLGTPQTLVTV